MCSIYSKLTITTPERRHGGHFDDFSQIAIVSIVDFEKVNTGRAVVCTNY